MKILILGGTQFVGAAITDEAVARGWQTTVFHRGNNPTPAGARSMLGDRREFLPDGEWDIVVDTWDGAPSVVRDAVRVLTGRIGRYAYISSRSVYEVPFPPDLSERSPVMDGSADDGSVDYRRAKRGGELAAGPEALLVRAGVIVGPRENSGRLTWWLQQIARGGDVVAPGPRDLTLQFIDARDLAIWTLDAAARTLSGPYNLVSPPGHTTMGDLLDSCVRVIGANTALRWTPPEQILAAGVRPFVDLPLWIPPGDMHSALHQGNVAKAVMAGLQCRPAAETVEDTWAWLRDLPGEPPTRARHAPRSA
jgi:2'-hydroxyisoflavone reductase